MAESPPYADEATLYVLGLLGRRERRNFEARLKNSSELRALVRALETGAVALTMATPRRDPPTRVWEGIQTAIAQEAEKRVIASVFASPWIRAALAIAACAIFGCFVHVLWFNGSPAADTPPQVAVHQSGKNIGHVGQNPPAPERQRAVPESATARQPSGEPHASVRVPLPNESATVHQKIAELASQVAYLSQALTQQQVLPPGFSRVTFFNFDAAGSDGVAAHAPTPSPELRRALLLALARQWGWLPSLEHNQNQQPSQATRATQEHGTQGAQQQRSEQRNVPAAQIESGIAFVELAPVSSDQPDPQTLSTQPSVSEPSSPESSTLSAPSETSVPSSIPGFVSGPDLVLAFDSSVLPTGTDRLTFSTFENGRAVSQNGVWLGSTPTVVSMPLQTRVLAGVNGANTVTLQVRAWNSTGSFTPNEALQRGGSVVFTYTIPQTSPPGITP
jgi:hypothetical protein